jgi:hypothetical protein
MTVKNTDHEATHYEIFRILFGSNYVFTTFISKRSEAMDIKFQLHKTKG